MSTKRLFCGTMFYASIVFEIFAYKYDFFVQLVQSILKYNRGIYMQNVLLRLREVQPSLSSTERQIAQFILENPDETTTLTIRDLARRSFSSPSSVVRICRVIGFQGYKELRHDAGACHPWRERQPPGKGHHPAGQPAGDRGQGDPQEHPEPAGHPAAAFAG